MEVREPSAKYLAKAAFKQTELGRFPSDWHVKQIGDFQPFVTSGSRGWASFYSGYGSLFVRITNLTRERIYLDLSDVRFVNLPAASSEGQRTQLKAGDVLISITADIGIVGYVTQAIPQPAYINQHIALVRFDPAKVHSRYVTYFLASESVQKLFRSLTDSGAKAGMNLATVKQVKFAVPDTLAEQQAIATALSDADALIESLEQLLAKKRQIKQGAMQELLTGKRRLPGFEGEWERHELRRLVSIPITDGPHLTPQFCETGVPFLSVNNLANNRIDLTDIRYISKEDDEVFSKKCKPKLNDILFGKAASVGKVAIVEDDFEFNIWSPIALIRSSSQVCAKFMYYRLLSADSISQVMLMTNASSQGNIGMGDIEKIQLSFPCLAEQTAIAEVLSDMDADITALEAKLIKARAIKQGMMQELLTGRIRLV